MMMVSVAVPAATSISHFARSSPPPQKLAFKPLSAWIPLPPKQAHLTRPIGSAPTSWRPNFWAAVGVATSDAVGAVDSSDSAASPENPGAGVDEKQETEKLGVVVKLMEKPRLVLKFVWLEKNIGLALDQVIPGHGTIPLSPYYFWPRKDAWEELKTMLESKSWISQKRMIILLNQATDIINLWQQSGGNL